MVFQCASSSLPVSSTSTTGATAYSCCSDIQDSQRYWKSLTFWGYFSRTEFSGWTGFFISSWKVMEMFWTFSSLLFFHDAILVPPPKKNIPSDLMQAFIEYLEIPSILKLIVPGLNFLNKLGSFMFSWKVMEMSWNFCHITFLNSAILSPPPPKYFHQHSSSFLEFVKIKVIKKSWKFAICIFKHVCVSRNNLQFLNHIMISKILSCILKMYHFQNLDVHPKVSPSEKMSIFLILKGIKAKISCHNIPAVSIDYGTGSKKPTSDHSNN